MMEMSSLPVPPVPHLQPEHQLHLSSLEPGVVQLGGLLYVEGAGAGAGGAGAGARGAGAGAGAGAGVAGDVHGESPGQSWGKLLLTPGQLSPHGGAGAATQEVS